jgi:hypothetical protein
VGTDFRPNFNHTISGRKNSGEGWWIVSRAPRARALVARARMFVMSQVLFFPNKQFSSSVHTYLHAFKII